jgi:hypothetical protein
MAGMTVMRNALTTLVLFGLMLTSCSDSPVVSGGSSDQPSVTEPTESDPDMAGAASVCPYGVNGSRVLDYVPPSPGATQTRKQALANFNGAPSRHDFVLQPEGWATQTNDAGTVIRVATFEQLQKGFFVVGATMNCVRP